jgi:hypothetical protein
VRGQPTVPLTDELPVACLPRPQSAVGNSYRRNCERSVVSAYGFPNRSRRPSARPACRTARRTGSGIPTRPSPRAVSDDGRAAVRAAARSPAELGDRLRGAARALESVGEQLQAGDRIITARSCRCPLTGGDQVVADLGELGRVQLLIASQPRS